MANIVSGAAPEAGQTASSIPTASEQQKPPEPAVKTAEKPVRTVPLGELTTIRVGGPEKQAEPITLSETTYTTLVNTIVSHIKAVDKLKRENKNPATADSAFYKKFTEQFPGENLSDPNNLKRCAEKYLLGGKKEALSGAEIQSGLGLIKMELATLQAALPRTFIAEGKPEYRRELKSDERETHIIITEDGSAEVSSKPAGGMWEKLFKGKKVKTSASYKLVGGKRLEVGKANQLLFEGQRNFLQEFLQENGLAAGDLNAEQLLAFDKRITSLMTASMELYLKAGCPLAEFDPNLIKVNPQNNTNSYIDTKTAYLSGEKAMTGTEDLRNVLGLEQKAIQKEIKARIEKELAETNAKKQTARAEETAESQFTGQIAKIKQKESSPEKQKVKKAEIDRGIKRLQGEVDLFIRQSDLAGELPEAEKARDEAKQKVTDHQATLKVGGETTIDLLAWSDPANTESWQKIESQYSDYLAEKQAVAELINRGNRRLEVYLKSAPNGLYSQTTKDSKGSTVTVDPNPQLTKKFFELDAIIDALEDKISKNPWPPGSTIGPTLEQLISETKAKFERRKKAVEQNADILNPYHEAERTLTTKTAEEQSADAKVNRLPDGEKSIDDIDLKIKAKQKELENIDKLGPEEQKEIGALEALKKVLPSEGRMKRNQRFSEAKKGELPEPEIAADSEWAKQQYSDEVLHCVQILFGDEILLPYPPTTESKALAEQVQALLSLPKYKDLWTTAIGSKTMKQIDEKVIDKIVENMRITALGLKKDLIK